MLKIHWVKSKTACYFSDATRFDWIFFNSRTKTIFRPWIQIFNPITFPFHGIASFKLSLKAIYNAFQGGSVPVLCWKRHFFISGRGPKPKAGKYKYPNEDRQASEDEVKRIQSEDLLLRFFLFFAERTIKNNNRKYS